MNQVWILFIKNKLLSCCPNYCLFSSLYCVRGIFEEANQNISLKSSSDLGDVSNISLRNDLVSCRMVRTCRRSVYIHTIELGTGLHLEFAHGLVADLLHIWDWMVAFVVNVPLIGWLKWRLLKMDWFGRHYGRLCAVINSELALCGRLEYRWGLRFCRHLLRAMIHPSCDRGLASLASTFHLPVVSDARERPFSGVASPLKRVYLVAVLA